MSKVTYPEWQKNIREVQQKRDKELAEQKRIAEEKQAAELAERTQTYNQRIKRVLQWLGLPVPDPWVEISFSSDDGIVFGDYFLYHFRTSAKSLPSCKEVRWGFLVEKRITEKDQEMLDWYKTYRDGEDPNTAPFYSRPPWPSSEISATYFIEDEEEGVDDAKYGQVALADALDRIDQIVTEMHEQWEKDKQAFAAYKITAVEEKAVLEKAPCEPGVYTISPEKVDGIVTLSKDSAQWKLLTALSEFFDEMDWGV